MDVRRPGQASDKPMLFMMRLHAAIVLSQSTRGWLQADICIASQGNLTSVRDGEMLMGAGDRRRLASIRRNARHKILPIFSSFLEPSESFRLS